MFSFFLWRLGFVPPKYFAELLQEPQCAGEQTLTGGNTFFVQVMCNFSLFVLATIWLQHQKYNVC